MRSEQVYYSSSPMSTTLNFVMDYVGEDRFDICVRLQSRRQQVSSPVKAVTERKNLAEVSCASSCAIMPPGFTIL
jgi:hypothetical protein